MKTDIEVKTMPYWMTTATLPPFEPPATDVEVDVAIMGGGITGITTAYLLKRAGRRVAVVERDRCGKVDTGHTTAHLTCVTDLMLSDLVRQFGRDHAQAVWDAGQAAIHQIQANVRAAKLACDFAWVPGYLHAPLAGDHPDERDHLRQEAALAAELGFDAMYLDRVPLMERPGIRFNDQARFHPWKYLGGLLAAIPGDGSHVFEHSTVDEVVDEPLALVSSGRTIRCHDLVMATHTPHVGTAGMARTTVLHTKLALYTSYVIGARVKAGLADALYWDTADPYHYLRIDQHDGSDYVILGGEDHKTGQESDTKACFERLESLLQQLMPEATVDHRWSGQVVESHDGLPYIGEIVPSQFVATGYAGNGMTFGTLGAMMIADAIQGRGNPWQELFDVGRTKIRAGAWNYIKENADYPYYMIRDLFSGADKRSLRGLGPGEGRVLEIEGKLVAASRDGTGRLTLLSPICPHMGCRVNWNEAGHTWDCPCHGSRFKDTGEVIAGPADSPLPPAEVSIPSDRLPAGPAR